MDTIDREILAAESPLDVKEPDRDYLMSLRDALDKFHGDKCKGDDENEPCQLETALRGHVYLQFRILAGLPHIFCVTLAKRIVSDVANGTVPTHRKEFAEYAEAIKAAKDISAGSFLPTSILN